MAIRQQSLDRVVSLCHNNIHILSKIWADAGYGAKACIYQECTVADMELNSSQCILLALLHSLVTEEIMSCCLLADVCHQVWQLQSDYLSIWLTKDFVFPRQDMEKAMALLAKLLETGVLKLPSHVTRILSSVATKYRIYCVQLISPSAKGHDELAILLEEAVENNSPGDIIAIASDGGDVNGLTQHRDSLIHLAVRLGNCSSIATLGFLKANLEVLNSSNATPLEEAVKNNCVSSVKALLSVGAQVDKCLFRGDTYLHIAAAGGQNGVLQVLLERGIDVNQKNHFDETPLFRAVRAENVRGVELLLDKGADDKIFPQGCKSLLEMSMESDNVEMFKALVKGGSNLKFKGDDTIFHLVARFGNAEMLKVIEDMSLPTNFGNRNVLMPLHIAPDTSVLETAIRMGLDVNDRTGNGETALYLGSAKGSLELVKALCRMGAAVDLQNNGGTSALMIALKNSKEDIVAFLLLNGANLKIKDKEGRTVLHYAAEGGCATSVVTLLAAGARVNDQDNKCATPAFVAAVNNKPAVLQLLVENGADLDIRDPNCDGLLHHAVRSGYIEVVTTLLDAGAEVDMEGQYQWTALHLAAKGGHNEVVTALLVGGAAVDMKDQNQRTALHLAAEGGHTAIVTVLLEAGLAVDIKDQDQRTALHSAAKGGHTPVVSALLKAGAAVDITFTCNKWTALHLAALEGHSAVVTALLDGGAMVDIKDQYQRTALHLSAEKGHAAVVTVLLDRGANSAAKNNYGFTPLITASTYGHLAVVRRLVDCGAILDVKDNNGRTASLSAYHNKHWTVADYLRSKEGGQ